MKNNGGSRRKLRKGGIVALLIGATFLISGCSIAHYEFQFYNGCTGPLGACGQHRFTVLEDPTNKIISACTAGYGRSGRADCALRLIKANCQQEPPPNLAPALCNKLGDVTQFGGYTHIGGSMEAAIEAVEGPQECLTWLEYVYPSNVVYEWWQGTDRGQYGCG